MKSLSACGHSNESYWTVLYLRDNKFINYCKSVEHCNKTWKNWPIFFQVSIRISILAIRSNRRQETVSVAKDSLFKTTKIVYHYFCLIELMRRHLLDFFLQILKWHDISSCRTCDFINSKLHWLQNVKLQCYVLSFEKVRVSELSLLIVSLLFREVDSTTHEQNGTERKIHGNAHEQNQAVILSN